MTTSYSELRETIARNRAGRPHWRCPNALRERIVAFARQRQQAGETMTRIAEQVGLSVTCVRRWMKAGDGPRLRPVRIAETSSSPSSTSRDSLALITPNGYRLEGLNAATAVDVLRRLAC